MKKRKFYPTAALLLGFLAVMTVVDLATPMREKSEMENRPLKTSVSFSFKKLLSGDFQSGYETLVTDQFAGRDGWITVKSMTESALLKTENNGILYGKNGALFGKLLSYDEEQLARNLSFVQQVADTYAGASGSAPRVTLGIIPSGYTYSPDQLPTGAGQLDQRAVLAEIEDSLTGELGWFDVDAVLSAQGSESLYYNTDHHWKGTTAYLAYAAFCEQNGMEPVSTEKLILREIPDFYGTYFSKCKKADTQPDTLLFYDLPYDIEVTVDGEEKDNWYDETAFDARDKYAAFLYGNGGLTVLRRDEIPDNPRRLLLVKDSYSNCLAQLFLENYDEVYVVDLRSYPMGFHALCEEKNFDDILVLYNFENLQSDTNFYRVLY